MMTPLTTQDRARSEGGREAPARGGGSGAVRRCRTQSGDRLRLRTQVLEGNT